MAKINDSLDERSWSMHASFVVSLAIIALAGCTKAPVPPIPPPPGIPTTIIPQPETGQISLMMNPPLDFGQAKIELVAVGDGRPSMMQITSYDPDSGPGEGANLLIHGRTTATNVKELAGQKIECSLFLRTDTPQSVARSTNEHPVSLTVHEINVENSTLQATLSQSQLASADHQRIPMNGGRIVAVFD